MNGVVFFLLLFLKRGNIGPSLGIFSKSKFLVFQTIETAVNWHFDSPVRGICLIMLSKDIYLFSCMGIIIDIAPT